MPTAHESRAAMQLVSAEAVGASVSLIGQFGGSPEVRRAALLEAVPEVIGYFAEGTAALAVDFYDEQRSLAGVPHAFVPQLVIPDRTVKIRRAVAWASDPLFEGLDEAAGKRLAEVVQLEVARPFRETVTANRRADPEAIGWKRVTNQCCPFCSMLADKGAVYRESTARFAAHPHCDCSAAPVFRGGETGPEASPMQYMASRRSRSPEQKAALREYLAANY